MKRPYGYLTLEQLRPRPRAPRKSLWPAIVCFAAAAGLAWYWWIW